MIVSLIVAYDRQGGIGLNGAIPWKLPSDLRRFKQLTMGHHIVMGRKTWDSIGRPLPGRQSIIITQQTEFTQPGADVVHSLADALALANQRGEKECFVIGGGAIYAQALPLADRIYATLVQTVIPQADVFFSEPSPAAWKEIEHSDFQEPGDQFRYIFKILEPLKVSFQ